MTSSRRTRTTVAAAGGALLLTALAPWTTAHAAPAAATLDCTVAPFDDEMSWSTTADVTAARTGASSAAVSVTLGALPGLAPLAMTDVPIRGTASATVNGSPVSLSGSHSVPSLAANAPIPTPGLKGTVSGLTTSTNSLAVQISSANFVATAMGLTVTIDCTSVSGLTRNVPIPSVLPAPKPSATTSKATVKVSKEKVATVKVSVAAKKAKATGKVTVTVLKGKKKVASKTLTLRKGSASLKTKKLKKGKYTVKVTYKATKTFKASKKTVTFRVK